MKKLITVLLMLFCIVAFVGCKDSKDVKPTNITVIGKDELIVGNKMDLKLTFAPADTTLKDVVYSIDNSDIATVNEKGTVTALKAGNCTITVTSKADNSVKGTLKLEVKEENIILPTSITVTGVSNILVDSTLQLKHSIMPSDCTEKDVIYTSLTPLVATVTASGLVTGVGEGNATIRCSSVVDEKIFCDYKVNVTADPKNIVQIEEISFTINGLLDDKDMVIDNKFTVKAELTPARANQYELEYSSSDTNVATISDRGVVTCLSKGKVTIKVFDTISLNEYSKEFEVVDAPQITDFAIVGGRDITTSETLVLKISTTPLFAKYDVTYRVNDESVATINQEGVLKPLKEGTVVVYVKENNLNTEKNISVVINKAFDANTKPEEIKIEGADNAICGYSIQLKATVYPQGVSQAVVWSVVVGDTTSVITEDGLFTASQEGTYRIKAYTPDKKVSSKAFTVIVSEPPKERDPQNLGGRTIIIMNAESALADIDPFLPEYKDADKKFKQTAWREVETAYNCTIKVVKYPDTATWGESRISYLNELAQVNKSECDFGIVSASWLWRFARNKTARDVTEYFNRYGKNQITNAQLASASYGGKIYAVSYGISDTTIFPYYGLFYNYGMLKKYNLESPAKLFNEDKWTYEDFVNYCKNAQAIMASDEYVIAGAPTLIWSGMVNSSGIMLADRNEKKLNLTHPYSIEALQCMHEIVEAKAWDIEHIDYDEKVVAFQSGKALFQPGEYWFVRADNRFKSNMWGANTEFGYVPYPYQKNVGKENSMVNTIGTPIMMMVNGRNYDDDTAEGIYRAMLTLYQNTIKYQKEDPQYDAQAIKNTVVSSKVDDSESVVATLYFTNSKTLYDPLLDGSFQYEYSGKTCEAVNRITSKGVDANEELSSIYNEVYNKFIEIFG